MREDLVNYIEFKINKVNRELKENLYKQKLIDYLSDYLLVMEEVTDELTPSMVEVLCDNIKCVKTVLSAYKILKPDDAFYSILVDLNRKVASSNNYSFLIRQIRYILSFNKSLYEEYDNQRMIVSDYKKEEEQLTYNKMLLEYAKDDIENERTITDKGLYDLILEDSFINPNKKTNVIIDLINYNEKAFKNYVPMSINEAKEVLESFGYKKISTDNIEKIRNAYKLNILSDILSCIKNLNLHFKDSVLAKILINGTTKETIIKTYNQILSDDAYTMEGATGVPTFWIDRSYSLSYKENYGSSVLVNKSTSDKSKEKDNIDMDVLNATETFETAEYLKGFAFYNPEFNEMKSLLKLSVESLMKREAMLKLYKIGRKDITESTTLYSSNLINTFDQFIELGLKDYILNHSATISRSRKIPVNIYRLKKKGIEPLNRTKTELVGDANDLTKGYDELIALNGITEYDIKYRKDYDHILQVNNPNKITPNIYKVPTINYLEKYHKVNDFEYKIGNFIISRIKVLRIASSLIEEERMTFDEFKYIITYQSLFDKEDLDNLEEQLMMVYSFSLGKNFKS